jgi:hypothetical protein
MILMLEKLNKRGFRKETKEVIQNLCYQGGVTGLF